MIAWKNKITCIW